MAFLEINNVRIAGMSTGVPATIVKNTDDTVHSENYDAASFVETTGVAERRYSQSLTTSDLCYAAAEKLISDLKWEKSEIDGLIFVSQTNDYIEPATACILQDRLGLSKECYAFDMGLGCSGWVYGLSSAASLITSGLKKVLILAGDAKMRVADDEDPLFGFAGTATALEYAEGCESLKFHFGTDGSGFDAIVIPNGGSRNQISKEAFEMETIDGKQYNRYMVRMKGMDVFSFGITTAPKSVKKLSERFGMDYQEYDYLILHQANMKMNDFIVKKLKVSPDKAPSSMRYFGNTSSASIPLTVTTQLGQNACNSKMICCGFGIGLSWGTVAFSLDKAIISELVEVNDELSNNKYVV